MAAVDAEDMDTANNNTMSNNNNSSNINNNAVPSNTQLSSACGVPESTADTPSDNSVATSTAVTVVCGGNNSSSSSNRSRSSSSRRSRSGGRSRSRRRHSQSSGRRSSRHHSRQSHKRRERNFPSALCSMISIVILCTALAEPRWIRIEDGHCTLPTGRSLNYLGAFQFFYFGDMVYDDPHIDHKQVVIAEYRYGPDDNDRMINCVRERAVVIFKIVIALTFLAILTSLIGFGLDLVGLGHRLFKLLRRSAIFNIFTVLVCVGITLFLYWATVDILNLQLEIPDSTARVSFDVSFYLITAAGACSVIAVACNCLRRKITEMEPAPARNILDDQFNEDTENLLSIPPPGFHGPDSSPMSNLPPPPPYTP